MNYQTFLDFFSFFPTFINISEKNMYIEIVKKDGGFFTHGEILSYDITGNFLITISEIADRKTINKVYNLDEINYFKVYYENENNEKN